MIADLRKKYESLGLLGICDRLLFKIKKRFLYLWYIKRFVSSGKSVVFEGSMNIVGGRGIKLGNNIVFGKNVRLRCDENSKLIINDDCYIAENVILTSTNYVNIGKGTKIHEGSIVGGENIKVGEKVWISRYSTVQGIDISIGNESILSPFVYIIDNDHYVDPKTGRITLDKGNTAPVRLEENVWVCKGSIILKGVNIGCNSIIAAGSVVTHNVPERSMAAGATAKIIKKYGPKFLKALKSEMEV